MAKKKKIRTLNIQDFFGVLNTYRIFALKSELSAFPFANELGQALGITFTVLNDYNYVSNRLSANFTVFYSEYAQQEPIHCLLLENRTETNQQELFVSKSNRNSHILNYSLFAESLYLFNNQGLRCFDMPLADMDFFLLLFAKKEIENETFLQLMNKLSSFRAKDVSYMLRKEQTAAEAKVAAFLREFYCKYEVKANQFSRRRKIDLLSPIQQIPTQNLQYPIPIILEYESVTDNLQLSEEYLAFLEEV